MKNNLVWLTVTIFIFSALVFSFRQIASFKAEEINYKRDIFEWQKNTYKIELIKFCQNLSATRVNEGWNYKNCLEELKVNQLVYRD